MANEKRLIDANAYPCRGCSHEYCYQNCKDFIEWFNNTVDAVEVVHGHWEYGKWEQGHWVKGNERCRCSVCHRDFAVDNSNIWHGCPQCLAKMDGDGNG